MLDHGIPKRSLGMAAAHGFGEPAHHRPGFMCPQQAGGVIDLPDTGKPALRAFRICQQPALLFEVAEGNQKVGQSGGAFDA